MQLKSLILTGCVLFAAQSTQAGVVSTIDYLGVVFAGDEALNLASYTDTDIDGLPFVADESVLVQDNNGGVRGAAFAAGQAENDGSTLSFGQQVGGLGAHASFGGTFVEQVITNDGPTSATGTFRSEIFAGGLGLFTDDSNALSNFDGFASFQIDISLDGSNLLTLGASIDSDGGLNTTNINLLNDAEFASNGFSALLGWQATEIELDLGLFNVGESKTLEYALTAFTAESTGCQELTPNDCLSATASIGDPDDFGFGYAFLYSTYLPPAAVPAPAPLGLLAFGLLLLRRARGNA